MGGVCMLKGRLLQMFQVAKRARVQKQSTTYTKAHTQ